MRLDKKKMIAAIIVACTTLFIAIGIHEKKDTRKQLKFGATYMTMNNPYFVNMDENIEESVQAKGDILITRDPLQDQKKQNEQIKDMINEGIDVLFLQPVDRNKVRPALELCKKKHIPVVVIDSEVSDTEAVVSTKDGKKAFFSGTKVNEAVKFVKKLNEMNGGREVTQNDFDSGNVAFMPLAFSEYRTYKTYPYKIKKYTSFQWDCTSMPAGPGGHNTSEVDALLMTIGNKSKHKELAWEFLKMLTSDSSIQREIFEYSQGASVLKYVTGSRYAESMIRKDMDVDERVIDNRLLIDAIENGRINPKFSKYPEAMALAENEIDDIYKNEKNIDSSLKVFQRSITKFLNQ